MGEPRGAGPAKIKREGMQNRQLVFSFPAELAFPATANVFYAMNSSGQDFMLRPRPEKPGLLPLPTTPAPVPPPRTHVAKGVEISATFPKIKATGRKIAKALF